MKTIVCIEDQPDYQQILIKTLRDYQVHICSTLKEAKDYLSKKTAFDLLIVDVSLPDGDGIRFFSTQKDHLETLGIPVIFLSASTDIENKLTALHLGAEDYLCKPIHPLELKVRVQAKLEKLKKQKEELKDWVLGSLSIDLTRQRVRNIKTDSFLDLTSLEFRILVYFSKNLERVLSREQILDSVWGQGVAVQDRTVDTHVSHLRKKIKDCGLRIDPVQGMGYRTILGD
jgi:two-component system, OmpR family, phosphate regulon response regulator PhoB